jgi:hypothetical protein
MVVAQRILSEEEAATWLARHNAARVSTEGREEKMEAVAEEIENGLTVIGTHHCTRAVLVLYSYCTHTVLIPSKYCTHTVLILYSSHCTHTV